MQTEKWELKVYLERPYLILPDTPARAQQEEGKKRAVDGMQPFGWPCGQLREEGRRQVDIWPVCYCEFQILWLSLTLNLLEFFNLGIPETVPSQRLTSLLALSPFSDPPAPPLTKRVLRTHTTRIPCLGIKAGGGGNQYLTDPRARGQVSF